MSPNAQGPWRGIGGLFALSLIVSPMVVLQGPVPAVLNGESLVPVGVVIALIIAVFRAGQQMQKLTDKLKVLDRLVERVSVLESHLGVVHDEAE